MPQTTAGMAEQQQGNALASAFPTPPPFYQHFTEENLGRIAALSAELGPDSNQKNGSLTTLDLPSELRYLRPPEPPAEGTYRSFGDLYNVFSLQFNPWVDSGLFY